MKELERSLDLDSLLFALFLSLLSLCMLVVLDMLLVLLLLAGIPDAAVLLAALLPIIPGAVDMPESSGIGTLNESTRLRYKGDAMQDTLADEEVEKEEEGAGREEKSRGKRCDATKRVALHCTDDDEEEDGANDEEEEENEEGASHHVGVFPDETLGTDSIPFSLKNIGSQWQSIEGLKRAGKDSDNFEIILARIACAFCFGSKNGMCRTPLERCGKKDDVGAAHNAL